MCVRVRASYVCIWRGRAPLNDLFVACFPSWGIFCACFCRSMWRAGQIFKQNGSQTSSSLPPQGAQGQEEVQAPLPPQGAQGKEEVPPPSSQEVCQRQRLRCLTDGLHIRRSSPGEAAHPFLPVRWSFGPFAVSGLVMLFMISPTFCLAPCLALSCACVRVFVCRRGL